MGPEQGPGGELENRVFLTRCHLLLSLVGLAQAGLYIALVGELEEPVGGHYQGSIGTQATHLDSSVQCAVLNVQGRWCSV